MATSMHHDPTTPTRSRQIFGARRGSALLLAVGVLLLVFLAGVAFVSGAQSLRIAGSASARTSNTDAAIEATVDYIGQVIAKDWTDYTSNPTTGTSEYYDYPGPSDRWLATIEPEDFSRFDGTTQIYLESWSFIEQAQLGGDSDGDGTTDNDWDVWRQISNLPTADGTAELPFIDVRYFQPVGTDIPEGNTFDINTLTNQKPTLAYHPVRAGSTFGEDNLGYNEPMTGDGLPDLSSGAATDENAEFFLATTADADGDGYIDSRWVELPINTPGGLRWAAAVRIIDETGLANVNTAGELHEAIGTEADKRRHMVLGSTPHDLNLKRLLARADFTVGTNADWGDAPNNLPWSSVGEDYQQLSGDVTTVTQSIGFTTGSRNAPTLGQFSFDFITEGNSLTRSALYTSLGYPRVDVTNTAFTSARYGRADRDLRWQMFGRNLDVPPVYTTTASVDFDAPYNENETLTLNNQTYLPFGTDTLAELRRRFGLNSSGWSALEYSLLQEDSDPTDGDAWSVLRSNRVETPGWASRRQMRQGVRHLLTTYSGARQVRPNLAGGGTVDYADPESRAKFNINLLDETNIDDFVERAREAGVDAADAVALAANAFAYRVPGTYDDVDTGFGVADDWSALSDFETSNASAGGQRSLGLEAQPFFREAASIIVAEDPPDGTVSVTSEDRYLIVEIANPWDATANGYETDVELSDFEIVVTAGGTDTSITLNAGTLAAGEEVLLHSPGMNITSLNPSVSGPAAQPILPNNAWTQGQSIEFRLEYGGEVVDRFRAHNTVGPPAVNDDFPLDETNVYGGRLAPVDGETVVYTSYLRRDDRETNGTPHYVLERDSQNEVSTTPTRSVFTTATPLPADFSGELDETFGDAGNGVNFNPTPPAFQLHLGKVGDGTATNPVAPAFDSVAELGMLPVVAHRADTNVPISERLGSALVGATAGKERYFGKLDWTEIPNGESLPDAVHLMDQFTTLDGPDSTAISGSPALNPGMAFGVVNINTAPRRVLEALPFVLGGNATDNHPMTLPPPRDGQQLAEGILDYRDLPETGPFSTVGGTRNAAIPDITTSGTGTIRASPGFASIGELTLIRGGGVSDNRFDYLAQGTGNADETDGDFTVDAVDNDLEEELLPFMRTAGLISVRSDVFTAYVILQGRRPNADNPLLYDKVVERRFIVTYDRSNVNEAGDKPRVLMFTEDR
ncbi:hypothetical protein [Mucisphaera sp.]|uniref:hypothetical protein n=1 Tax=Mucisphaera sp. TaxID=2913024 RepID=UPI003D0B9F58